MISDKIKLLFDESIDPDEKLIAALEEISTVPDVHRVVGMVDLHLKKRTENPSSVAIASRGRIIPKLSSVAQNCGMCLVRTSFDREDFTEERLNALFDHLRIEDDCTMKHPDISIEEMRDAMCLGARAVLGKYGFPESTLENIEYGGVIGDPELLSWKKLRKLVPLSSLRRGRHGFGVIPAGNHFFEIQYIYDVIDREECERRGLADNGITLMIHSDGGLVSDDIGNLYGNRSTAAGYVKLLYDLRRTVLHLKDARGIENWREKRRYYFGEDKYVMISPETYEGKRYIKAKNLSMNAGYASRLTTIGRLRDVLGRVFESRDTGIEVLCDFSHNSILPETVDNEMMWVHRHNACRVTPGRLVFLPGYNYTSSYICVGDAGAADFLNTMDHGAGKTIDRFKKKGITRILEDGYVTRNYSNESSEPETVPHYSDEGIDKVIEVLERNRIVRPIARVRPIAGYRYKWKGRLARVKDRIKTH